MSLVRPKMEHASCVWNPFYDVRVDSGTRAKAVYLICFAWFIFDVLSGRVNSPNLLSVLDWITPRYPTRDTEFLRIDLHRTNYGLHQPMSGAMRQFNEVIGLFDFSLTRDRFLNRLRLTL
jgi:hypothetical protein